MVLIFVVSDLVGREGALMMAVHEKTDGGNEGLWNMLM